MDTMVAPRVALLCVCLVALLCPAMCLGMWFAHDADAELPGQHDEQPSCAQHGCFCDGATVSPPKRVDLQASELLVAAASLFSLQHVSATDFLAHAEAISVVTVPPASERVLPLLI